MIFFFETNSRTIVQFCKRRVRQKQMFTLIFVLCCAIIITLIYQACSSSSSTHNNKSHRHHQRTWEINRLSFLYAHIKGHRCYHYRHATTIRQPRCRHATHTHTQYTKYISHVLSTFRYIYINIYMINLLCVVTFWKQNFRKKYF